ncbi:MAG: hypothetical protein ACRDJH_22615 [Thermomicrobiales bacterium]
MDNKPAPEFHAIEQEEDWKAQGWSTTPIPKTVDPEAGAVISIRLNMDSLRLIDRAAKAAGLSWAEYVKRAALDASRASGNEDPAPSGASNDLRLVGGPSTPPREINQKSDDHPTSSRRTHRTSGD